MATKYNMVIRAKIISNQPEHILSESYDVILRTLDKGISQISQLEIFIDKVEDNVGINYVDKYDCRIQQGCDCLNNA